MSKLLLEIYGMRKDKNNISIQKVFVEKKLMIIINK